MIDYSIIIPSKNLPNLLERALASIPRRDDFQVIVVDDASDPAFVDFDHYPGLDDPRVNLIFTSDSPLGQSENSERPVPTAKVEFVTPRTGRGAGYARNVGLERAAGRWTLFLDCDDFFTPDCLDLLDAHLDDPADIVYFNITSAYSDDLSYSPRHLSRSEYFTRYDGPKREFCCRYLYTEPWGKMFRTSFLRPSPDNGATSSDSSPAPAVNPAPSRFRFDETPLANDFKFSILTGLAAIRITTDARPLCCITERHGSLSHDFCKTPEQLSTRLAVYSDVQSLLDAAGVKSYPFYKLVNFTLRHRRPLVPILRAFCQSSCNPSASSPSSPTPTDGHIPDHYPGIGFTRLRARTFLLRILFARYHRNHWAVF